MEHTNSQIRLIPVSEVRVLEDRQRQSFDMEALKALYHRISSDGLMHPPGVNFLEGEAPTLIYGERRLRTLKAMAAQNIPVKFNGETLPVGLIPVVYWSEPDVARLEELELSENSDRVDLTWQEQARATARIKSILEARTERAAIQQQVAEGVPEDEAKANIETHSIELPTVSLTDVAKAGGASVATVSRHIELAQHLSDPDVAKAKTAKEALKVLEKKRVQEHRKAVAEKVVFTDSPHKIFKGDVLDVIKTLPDNFVRAIVTDPPYGIDMHKDQSWDGTYHEYNDTESYCFNLFEKLIPEWDRITLSQAHVYAFCDFAKFEKIRAIFDSYRYDSKGEPGFLVTPEAALKHNFGIQESKTMLKTKPVFDVMYFPFIWNKGNVASYPRAQHWPRKSYECLLYAIKGDHQQTSLDLAVININQIQNQPHPAGKPVDLYSHLIERSTMAGEVVFDGFAGQGNVVRAAHKLKRIAYAVELSDEYYPMLVEAFNETKGD